MKHVDENLQVTSSDPTAGAYNFGGGESVPKQEMPKSTYEQLPDTVLDYKKKHQIGRFDPTAPQKQEQKVKDMWSRIDEKGESRDS